MIIVEIQTASDFISRGSNLYVGTDAWIAFDMGRAWDNAQG